MSPPGSSRCRSVCGCSGAGHDDRVLLHGDPLVEAVVELAGQV